MSRPSRRPTALRGRIFHGPSVISDGLLTQAQLRSAAWRRLMRGVYADSRLPDTHELRCRAVATYLLPGGGAIAGRSAATVLPGGGAIAGRSAATLLGPGLSDAADPVEILVPAGARPRSREVTAHGS